MSVVFVTRRWRCWMRCWQRALERQATRVWSWSSALTCSTRTDRRGSSAAWQVNFSLHLGALSTTTAEGQCTGTKKDFNLFNTFTFILYFYMIFEMIKVSFCFINEEFIWIFFPKSCLSVTVGWLVHWTLEQRKFHRRKPGGKQDSLKLEGKHASNLYQK